MRGIEMQHMRQRGGLGAKFKVKRAWKSTNKKEWGAREQQDHTSQLSETEIRDKAKKHKDRRWRSGILCNKRGEKSIPDRLRGQ